MNPWWELGDDQKSELGRKVNATVESARLFADLETALNYSRWPEMIMEFLGFYVAYTTAH